MSAWPWFPFYVDDFLASPKVRRMNGAEVGAYLLLMLEQWQSGYVDGSDMTELSRITRSKPATVQKVLDLCFEPTPKGWVNQRLDSLRKGQDVKSEKARASAKARWDKGSGHANALRTQSEGNANQNQSQNHTPPSVEASEGGRKKRKAALPSDWMPNEGHRRRAKEDGLNAELEVRAFREYHEAHGNVRASWDASFYTWLTNAKKFEKRDGKRPSEGANEAILAREAAEWQETLRAAKAREASEMERLTKAATVRNGASPPNVNEPSGPLAGPLARVLGAAQPAEKAS